MQFGGGALSYIFSERLQTRMTLTDRRKRTNCGRNLKNPLSCYSALCNKKSTTPTEARVLTFSVRGTHCLSAACKSKAKPSGVMLGTVSASCAKPSFPKTRRLSMVTINIHELFRQ